MKIDLQSNNHDRYFTLIELLLIIAIIALLTSILMPALKTARDRAKDIICLANQKQLGVGFGMYLGDYNSFFPPYDTYEQTRNWAYSLYHDIGVKNKDVYLCPRAGQAVTDSFNTAYDTWKNHAYGPMYVSSKYVAYGYNWRNLGCSYYETSSVSSPPAKISDLSNPSSTIKLLDTCERKDSSTGPIERGHYICEYSDAVYWAYPNVCHDRSLNILWSDGHAGRWQIANPVQPHFSLGIGNSTTPTNYWLRKR